MFSIKVNSGNFFVLSAKLLPILMEIEISFVYSVFYVVYSTREKKKILLHL